MKKNKVSFEEFNDSIYHTQYHIRIPMLDIKLNKYDYFTNGKYDIGKVRDEINRIYKENLNKLNGEF